MKYLRKYNEGFDTNREWMDMSPEEREETSIPAYGEDDVDFIITKIKEKYPEAEDKADLLDMICWFEDEFKRDIVDEDEVLNQLIIEYGL
jgi:hypothetical protein